MDSAKLIAQDIIKLSDFYITQPKSKTPWKESWAQNAYLQYYNYLNSIRLDHVYWRGKQVGFFESLRQIIDFGSGLGASTWPLIHSHVDLSFSKMTHIERSAEARKIHQDLIQQNYSPFQNTTPGQKTKNIEHVFLERGSKENIHFPSQTLISFSYSKTELNELPPWIFDAEALLIAEPATHQDGRALLETRQKLVELGYFIWAPCLHQDECPLLKFSKTDWCHDRIHWTPHPEFEKIQSHLPMKQNTLTTSYLLARKTPPPKITGLARITGDRLEEKGKTRQLICRQSEREFLVWMDRDKVDQPELPRGDLLILPDFDLKSNELRTKQVVRVLESNQS